jgi:hypothetical protein
MKFDRRPAIWHGLAGMADWSDPRETNAALSVRMNILGIHLPDRFLAETIPSFAEVSASSRLVFVLYKKYEESQNC